MTSRSRDSRAGGRFPLMAGNWKMQENHFEAIALVQKLAFTLTGKDFDSVEVAVLPPFTALRSVQTLIDGDKLRISYGAQDLSQHDAGAYTGDISGSMLAKLGCDYVLAGHSERRQYHAETDELVGAKVQAALRWELTPILCVGELLEVRQAGQHIPHILGQLDAALKGILYGGSAKPGNIAPIMAQPDVDGALVGGASLDAGQFAQICRYREVAA